MEPVNHRYLAVYGAMVATQVTEYYRENGTDTPMPKEDMEYIVIIAHEMAMFSEECQPVSEERVTLPTVKP